PAAAAEEEGPSVPLVGGTLPGTAETGGGRHGRVTWEYEWKDHFSAYDGDCQSYIERKYQEFLKGGRTQGFEARRLRGFQADDQQEGKVSFGCTAGLDGAMSAVEVSSAPGQGEGSTCGEEEFTPPPHRDRIFALIVIGTFCGQLGLSIIAPFFPAEAKEKGVQGTALGWIFSIFELATMVGTPITTRLLVRSGSKPILVAGNFLGGIANILNGLCWYVGDGAPFIVCCLLLRVVAGFAFSFESTAGYSLLSALFGQNVSTATGILEGVNGLAMILGPIVGSSLYSLAGGDSHLGYVLPFVILGLVELLFSFLTALLLPKLPSPPQNQPSLFNFSPKVLLACVNCVVSGIALGFLNPTLQPHLSAAPLHYSVQMVGLVLSAACGSYALVAVGVGALDDWAKGSIGPQLMALGALLSGISYLMLAPLPLQIGGQELMLTPALCWSSTMVLGIGVAFGLIPVYKQLISCALHEVPQERELAASSLFTIAMATGAFLGPTLGGLLLELVGARTAYSSTGILEVALAIVLFFVAMTPAFRQANTARSPLLGSA
ncbi:SLC18B1, partial [Symbiodinium microadriaticum]